MNRSEDKFLEKMLVFSAVFLIITGAYFLYKVPAAISHPTKDPPKQAFTGFFSSSSGCGGGSSATKACMQNIKTALVNYNNDLGFFPYIGTVKRDPRNYFCADEPCLGTSTSRNVLVASDVGSPFELGGLMPATYAKRWKGPYMDSDPAEFMTDAWENKIVYTFWGKAIYLHSSGPNGYFDPIDSVLAPSYSGDDIIMCVSRTKFG